MVPHITQEKLKELVDYDPETGVLTWLVKPSSQVEIGDVAGTPTKCGHWQIGVFGRTYFAHRLAWLLTYGELPARLDHKDCNGTNNRLDNLRPCTQGQNNANSRRRRDNTSGFKGVAYCKRDRRWKAYISISGRLKHLGHFSTAELAYEFRCLAADLLHGEFSNHGVHKCAVENT